jgi:predicted GIY-YIG superfamily endonuclease
MSKSRLVKKGHNYKEKPEKFLDASVGLLTRLDKICDSLLDNFVTDGKSHNVIDIMKAKSFNNLWTNETPNNKSNKHSRNEFSGLYAFAAVDGNNVDIMYIGISQTIRRRFAGHTKRKNKGSATWAYLMVKNKFKDLSNSEREAKIPEFQKKNIHPLKFTFYPIEDHMLLHLAEVYSVNKLHAYWNSFETH